MCTFLNFPASGSGRAYVGANPNKLAAWQDEEGGPYSLGPPLGFLWILGVNRLSDLDAVVCTALMISSMLGVESSSMGGSNAVGEGDDIATIAGFDGRVAKIRFAVKGMSLGNGASKPSKDALVGQPSINSRSKPADMFLQKSL